MAYIIAVANQKGGVAKTTTTVSLAGSLASLGRQVLAVDLDAHANLTLALGLNPTKTQGVIADVLLNSASLASICRPTSIPGIEVVPSNSQMELAERFLPVRQNHELLLREALIVLQDHSLHHSANQYEYILLDCPPSMSTVTLNALNAANLLIIPTQPEYFSAHALMPMMQVIRRVRSEANPVLIYRILLTMLDRRNRIHRNLSEQIRTTFGEGLFQTTIEIDTKLRESAVAGMPITQYKNGSRSAQQYIALAQELIQNVQEKYPQAA